MKLESVKKTEVFEKFNRIISKKEIKDLTLFMEQKRDKIEGLLWEGESWEAFMQRKREIGTKSDKE